MQEKWDYLIILDACRYDYFEKTWSKFLDMGNLTCKISPGTSTIEWRDKSFVTYCDDVVYISSNPFINSLIPVKGFLGTDYFYRVYDVWQKGWDLNLGTVLPETITAVAVNIIKQHKNSIIYIIKFC